MQMFCKLDEGTGAMPIRWCLDESEQEKIVGGKLTELQVVIDILYEGSNKTKERYIVPLGNEMQFVSFSRPGVVHVCMAIVSPKRNKTLDALRSYLESTSRGHKEKSLFRISNSEVKPSHETGWTSMYNLISYTYETIEVPESYFAKPLPKWLLWWVTFVPVQIQNRQMVNQCQMCKWFIFAFSIQIILTPPSMVLFAIISAIVLLVAVIVITSRGLMTAYLQFILGYRDLDWRKVADFSEGSTLSNVYRIAERNNWSSFYETDSDGNGLSAIRRLTQPTLLLVMLSIVIITISSNGGVIALALLMIALNIPGMITVLLRQPFMTKTIEIVENGSNEDLAFEAFKQEIAEMACPLKAANLAKMTNVSALPKGKQTLRLRAAAFKAKVCKPFAV